MTGMEHMKPNYIGSDKWQRLEIVKLVMPAIIRRYNGVSVSDRQDREQLVEWAFDLANEILTRHDGYCDDGSEDDPESEAGVLPDCCEHPTYIGGDKCMACGYELQNVQPYA